MIVEDEETILKFGAWALSHNGYEVTVAKNVTEAMEIAGRDKAHFDMLFSDLVLPDGYGTDLATRLSADNPDLGVILTSGYPDKQGQWPRIRERNWAFIQKPYQISELLQVLQKELNGNCGSTQAG